MEQSLIDSLKIFSKSLVIDIETVGQKSSYKNLNQATKQLWDKKARLLDKDCEELNKYEELFEQKAGIYAEFGQIVCIGLGAVLDENNELCIRLKSIIDSDEQNLLLTFAQLIEQYEQRNKQLVTFIGHNIKEFDLPYICRRMIINGVKIPESLQLSGKKPWEIPHEDTLQLWKFGDYKQYTSLELLCHVLNIPTPKNDISGDQVHQVFWNDNDLNRIAKYCLNDVLSTAKVFAKLKQVSITEIIPKIILQ